MQWTVASAIGIIKRTGGICNEKSIHHNHAGIKVLGAIDFLCSRGFRWYKEGRHIQ